MRSVVMVFSILTLLGGCSDESGTQKPQNDTGVTSDTSSDQLAITCDYPTENYGTIEGKTVQNFPTWQGYADADYLCKTPNEMVMDTAALRQITFQDFFCRSGCGKTKKKLLWVMVSAGWCGPCQEEVQATQAQYGPGQIDPRVHLVNVLYEDDQARPVTASFTKLWVETFKLTFPVAMDPEFKMAAYFDRNAVPFNMLVDLDTMTIVFRQTGANLRAVGNFMFQYLAEHP